MIHYIDSGLTSNLGHHSNAARRIAGEIRRRDIGCPIYGYIGMDDGLAKELSATPLFTVNTYASDPNNKISGWLNVFLESAAQFSKSLVMSFPASDTKLYVNSAGPAQLFGLINYLEFNTDARAVIEFGVDPGLEITQTEPGKLNLSVPDPRADARATFYHYCATKLSSSVLPRITMVTFDPDSSTAYQALMGRPVQTLPVPIAAYRPVRKRTALFKDNSICVSFLGHARGEKGVDIIPALLAELWGKLDHGKHLKVLVHTGGAPMSAEWKYNIKESSLSPVLDERCADEQIWNELLGHSDIIVLPYWPARFATSYSAIACEAIANGIPLVVPSHTTMARVAREHGGAAMEVTKDVDGPDAFSPELGAKGILSAVENFGELADRAVEGAKLWAERHGPARTVDAILGMLE